MINKGEILVIDDFIDKNYQEDIKDVLLGKEEWGDLLFQVSLVFQSFHDIFLSLNLN